MYARYRLSVAGVLLYKKLVEGILMEKTVYGCVGVSSTDQNEDRQMIALAEAGVPKKNFYMDKMSGKDFEGQDKTLCEPLSLTWYYRYSLL